MRCGECKFWGINVPDYPSGPLTNQDGEWRQCGRLEMEDSYEPKSGGTELAVLKDGSNYYAALKSRADFGCVLFVGKES